MMDRKLTGLMWNKVQVDNGLYAYIEELTAQLADAREEIEILKGQINVMVENYGIR